MKTAVFALAAAGGAVAAAIEAAKSAGPYAWADLPIPDVVIANVPTSDAAYGNLRAFLAVIREGESSDNYRALVGGGSFSSFAAHPASLGWPGIRRQDDGRLTTAAGAYQITHTTYKDLGGGPFDVEDQDILAVRLLIRRGAYGMILRGDIAGAVERLPNEWEMFKTARWNSDRVVSEYQSNGGFLA